MTFCLGGSLALITSLPLLYGFCSFLTSITFNAGPRIACLHGRQQTSLFKKTDDMNLKPICAISLLTLVLLSEGSRSQTPYVYTIKADSVKITNCDSAELILENHTQGVPGFLFNTGNGRTIFKRGAQKLNDTMYLVGADTITLPSSNYWSLNGNTGINGSTQYLGTTDNTPLTLRTQGAVRMTLYGTGNVGINTSSDNGYRFQVNGQLWSNGTKNFLGNLEVVSGATGDYADNIRIDAEDHVPFIFHGAYIGGNDMFQFNDWEDGAGMQLTAQNESIIHIRSGFSSSNLPYDASVLYITPNYDLISTSHADTIRGIYYDPVITNLVSGSRHIGIETVTGDILLGTTSGNVGIGTEFPSTQLHTTGGVRFAGLTQDSTQTRVIVADSSGNLYYRSASSLAIDEPLRSSLAVNGPIRAHKLILSPDGWADYVFDSAYRLPPLTEVESFLRKEHHLAGIPSAGEVKANGLDVAAEQAALLKKIEELTLYSIEQDKKLQEQQKEVDLLRQKMDKLEQLLNSASLKQAQK